MSETAIAEPACDTDQHNGDSLARGHHWIGFVATPSFALLALLTAAHGGGPAHSAEVGHPFRLKSATHSD
jgi:hypothetical protein